MLRLILIILCFLLSILCVVPTPTSYIWYLTIMVTEFPWIFLTVVVILLLWSIETVKYRLPAVLLCSASLLMLLVPVIGAYRVGGALKARMEGAFGPGSADMKGMHREEPFTFTKMINGIGAPKVAYTTHVYAVHSGQQLTLDYYPSQIAGTRPCVVVVHGGSWRSSNSHELPDINWYLARQGYNVASVNYRLAPEFKSPAPLEDVAAAMTWLHEQSMQLHIDTNNFVLLGRSAGGHIVLMAAYSLQGQGIKGVVDFYGPTDMFWAYNNPDNPLVMHSQKVMADFLGGSDKKMPEQYRLASPVTYVTPRTVPTLIIHGKQDAHVHYELAEILDRKLLDNQVPHLLLGLPWATHGCEYTLNGPSGQLAVYAIERFVAHTTGASH